MNLTRKWFLIMCGFAFASVISFFQINSAFADKHNANTVFLIAGIVLGVAAIFCLLKVIKYGGTSKN